jgi:nitrogen fixation/metabolism regulation signal transduction histidine kinase
MKGLEEFKKAGPGETTDQDYIAEYVRRMLTDAGTEGRSENPPHGSGRTEAVHLEPLNANRLIEDVVPVLQRIVRRRARLRVESADRELRIMVNREKMSQVIASIVAYGTEIIKKGGTITILAKLLPLKSDVPGKGGCALLSVTSNDVAAGGPSPESKRRTISKESARRAFAAIRSIIVAHNGSISVTRLPGKAQFNIYLPILRGV